MNDTDRKTSDGRRGGGVHKEYLTNKESLSRKGVLER